MYIIRKDGMYLMDYMYNGIKEYIEGQEPTDVPTAIYSPDRRDAKLLEGKGLARLVGGEAIEVRCK